MPAPTSNESSADELGDLKRQLARFVRRIDLVGEIAARPWQAVGLAALAGAAMALSRRRDRGEHAAMRDKLFDVALAAVGTLVLRQVRDAAWLHVSGAARRWWSEAAADKPRPSKVVH